MTLNSYTREADPLLFISVNSSVLRWPCLGVEESREGRSWDNNQKWAAVITKIHTLRMVGFGFCLLNIFEDVYV